MKTNHRMMSLSAALLAAMAIAAGSVIAGEPSKGDKGAAPAAKAGGNEASPKGVKIGDKAPDFTLKDTNGKEVKLSSYTGKIVVLEWFNDDCPVVKQAHEDKSTMVNIASEFAPKGVVWIAIDSTNTKHANYGVNKDTVKSWGMDYPVLQDPDGKVGHAYGATNTPHMFIIGKDGKLAYKGAIDNDQRHEKPAAERVNYVKQALNQLTNGETVTEPETRAYGCTVKYGS
ncbi:MAG TPA: redoxin domain-containing protein [Phycisphaerales bacterium]|nr:redoxin domain-containing protein [Phycisphaerales bacterium]